MWVLILFALFAVTAFIRGTSAVNRGEDDLSRTGEPYVGSSRSRDAA